MFTVRLIQVGCVRHTYKALFKDNSSYLTKRWAGHSKWKNIQHTKAENDAKRSTLFVKLGRQMRVAIQETGEADPEFNSRLQSLIGQAKKANMPASSIQNILKTAKQAKPESASTATLEIRGPNRCIILLEIMSPLLIKTKGDIAQLLKKYKCKYETGCLNMFTMKGIIEAEPLKNISNPMEVATEHAIEFGAEEVTQNEENGIITFECSPTQTFKVQKKLELAGYTVLNATVEYIPNVYTELSDSEIDKLSILYDRLENMPEVVKIVDNIA